MNEQKRRQQVDGKWCCGKCKQYQLPENFGKISHSWNGLDTVCKFCRSDKRKTKEERENIWNFCLVKRYGVTKEDYYKLLEEQNNVCAICHKADISGRKLSVDHCHSTGEVRGLLCSKCNTALGLLGDNIELFVEAINYLKQFNI